MTWPLLTVAADRGTDGLCAMAYLRRALDELPDPSHDVTNNVTLAIQRAGLWPHEVLMQAWGRGLYIKHTQLYLRHPAPDPLQQ